MLDPMKTTSGGKVQAATYLWPDEAEALDRAAEEERVPKAEILRRALREWLERRPQGARK